MRGGGLRGRGDREDGNFGLDIEVLGIGYVRDGLRYD